MADPNGNGRVRDAVLETKLDNLTREVRLVIVDQEKRIRKLEARAVWGNIQDGAVALGALVAGILGTRT